MSMVERDLRPSAWSGVEAAAVVLFGVVLLLARASVHGSRAPLMLAAVYGALAFVSLSFTVPLDGPAPLGRVDEIESLIPRVGAECVFVASSSVGAEDMGLVTQAARRHGVRIRMSSNLEHVHTSRLAVHQHGADVVLSLRSDLADIEDSSRGTRIEIGPGVMIDAFVKIKAVGGTG